MEYFGLDAIAFEWTELLRNFEETQLISRLWQHDPTLFPGHILMLDWLNAPEVGLHSLPQLEVLKDKIQQRNFSAIALLGMGGSSLAARVFKQCLASSSGRPFFIVDTIHPSAIWRLEEQIDIKSTLFIVASKSGSTLEPNLLYHHFVTRLLEEGISDAASHFMAITDPVSSLEQRAAENGFLQGPFGSPLIGGRYSALSAFGLMPALLMDIDAKRLLLAARDMSELCRIEFPLPDNPGAMLGAFLGLNAIKGRDQLRLYFSERLKPLGGWLEQLIAESLGKNGQGITPILRDAPVDLESRSSMHCFIELDGELAFNSAKKRLSDDKTPYHTIRLANTYDIAAEMFRWEIGTSVAGTVIGVNPFDQPDVEKSKDAARAIMNNWDSMKQNIASADPIFYDHHVMESLIETAPSAKYCAILSYLDESHENLQVLSALAQKLQRALAMPVLVQTGPRYLHSTGQLFKGGANEGCFLMITGPYSHDFPSDILGLSFKDIHLSQALGDQEAMNKAQRKLWRLDLKNIQADIQALITKL